MLPYTEKIVEAYLTKEMFGDTPRSGPFSIFATEGGTAAMTDRTAKTRICVCHIQNGSFQNSSDSANAGQNCIVGPNDTVLAVDCKIDMVLMVAQ